MKVKDLIARLKLHDQELEVIVDMHSDYAIVEPEGIRVVEHCREEGGWVQYRRSDMATQKYLYLASY